MAAIEHGLQSGEIPWPTHTRQQGHERVWTPSALLTKKNMRQVEDEMRRVSDDVKLVFIGDTLTEEALPTYTALLTGTKGMPDEHDSQLQQWIREWSAEEERHGTVMDRYLFLSGAVDMDAYERSKHMLIADGMDNKTGKDPYRGFYYTSFQEIATQVSHANVARLAKDADAPLLKELCGTVAGDEAMHAKMYSSFVKTSLQHDPDGMTKAIADMMKNRIVMPAHFMKEVKDDAVTEPGPLFDAFSVHAQRSGVYTAKDYARISGRLLKEWGLAEPDDTGSWQVKDAEQLSEVSADAVAQCVRIQNVISKRAQKALLPDQPDHEFTWLLRND